MYNCPRCGKEQTTWKGTLRGLCEECETTLNKAFEEQANSPETSRERCLEEAMKIVCKDRNGQYGSPEDNFSMIANLWSAYLDKRINTVDVAMMMSLLKIARIKGSEYRSADSFVDLAGYAACGLECRERHYNCEVNQNDRERIFKSTNR